MIKTKAPLRINFAGGGTDIEPYISDYGSYILSAAINLYNRAFYPVNENGGTEIENILSALAVFSGEGRKVKILSDTEKEAGLGGSASLYVAGLKALYPSLDKGQLASLAFFLERKVQNIPGGIQDQICAAQGGVLFIAIEDFKLDIERLNLPDNFNRFLILIHTGQRQRSAEDIIADQVRCYNVKALHRQKQLARLMRTSLLNKNYIEFGQLLGEAWQRKKEQTCLVSTPEIDALYQKCLDSGAIGGLLTGAGSGGAMLLMEHPDKEGELRQNLILANIGYRNVEFDWEGARII